MQNAGRVKNWEIIPDNLHDAGWSLGWVATINGKGQRIWIVDAHGYGKRFIVCAEEILTALVELETAIYEFAVSLILRHCGALKTTSLQQNRSPLASIWRTWANNEARNLFVIDHRFADWANTSDA